jgi:CRISPR-associated protein (TIGR03984 family)
MELEIKKLCCRVQPLEIINFSADLSAWFQKQPKVGDKIWFLAHADDGIIWGQIRKGTLITSDSAFQRISPLLRAITLQQARIFGENAEVRVWRNGSEFQACRLEDQMDNSAEAFDEATILWGNKTEAKTEGFTLVSDGRQGLRHAVPIDVPDSAFGTNPTRRRPLRLLIRHYLTYDLEGQARIALSRLVNVYVKGG